MKHPDKPLLEMIGIDKTFGRQKVLKNCSLTVERGDTVVLIGPSGSGKSTLLRCVNLLAPADSGDVFLAARTSAVAKFRPISCVSVLVWFSELRTVLSSDRRRKHHAGTDDGAGCEPD